MGQPYNIWTSLICLILKFIHYLAFLDQRYEGEWKDNLQQGQGEHHFPSGHYDVAMWDQGPANEFEQTKPIVCTEKGSNVNKTSV